MHNRLPPQWIIDLCRPFAASEHGFVGKNDTGNPYVLKSRLIARLNRIVPGEWTMGEPKLMGQLGDVVTVSASLTILGQSHFAVGTGKVQRLKQDGTEKGAWEIAIETSKAVKGAHNDCLVRAAAMFGVAWYLRDIPSAWKSAIASRPGLEKYLAFCEGIYWEQNGNPETAKQALKEQGAPTTPSGAPIDTATGEIKKPAPAPDMPAWTAVALWEQTRSYWNDRNHFDASFAKHEAALRKLSLADAVAQVKANHWQYDADRRKAVLDAGTAMGLDTSEKTEALSHAAGHPITKLSEWDGGDESHAIGAFLAFASGYDRKIVTIEASKRDTTEAVENAAYAYCDSYNEKAKSHEPA